MAILQICDNFRKSVTGPYKKPLLLKNVREVKSDPCAKFCLNVIIVATNIASKHFSLKKAPGPGLKHLEMQLNFGDTGDAVEQGYHTLGKHLENSNVTEWLEFDMSRD